MVSVAVEEVYSFLFQRSQRENEFIAVLLERLGKFSL
jgi:hypothetical protein